LVIKFQDVNDLCNSGSELKLKDCHVKPVLPKEFFTVKTTKLTKEYFYDDSKIWKDGKYGKLPGKVMMKVSAVDADLLKSLREIKIEHSIKIESYTTLMNELCLQENQDSVLSWSNQINKLQHTYAKI
jgi:hypothetical protein